MEAPQIRPGLIRSTEPRLRITAFFRNSAPANSVIQQLVVLGVPADRLGVTPPERIESGQGMVLSIPCSDDVVATKVEALCRSQGADVHRHKFVHTA